MFRSVSSKVNFPQVEENILNLWEEHKVFEQSVARRMCCLVSSRTLSLAIRQ